MKSVRYILSAVLLTSLLLFMGCGPLAPPEKEAAKTEPAAKAPEVPKAPEKEPEKKQPEPVETAKLTPPKPAPKVIEKPKPRPPTQPVVSMVTSMGTMKIQLDPKRAPETVKNFLQYTDDGFFDGTIFHRVVPNFMIQGGGFEPGMKKKQTRAPIKNESANGLANLRGTIAMARISDPHSGTAQFYINHKTNQALDKSHASDGWGYCVFGKVIAGLDVVDKIAAVPTGRAGGMSDVPRETVLIKSVSRVN